MPFTSQVDLPVTKHNRCTEELRTTKARSEGCRPTGIHRIPLSEGLLWGQDSVICSAAWTLLHLFYPINSVLIFVSKRSLCLQLTMEIYKKPSDVWGGKTLKSLKRKIQGWIMEQFLWRDRLSTADSEISPRMHRESAKGSGAFLFIRAFFPPSYTLWKTSFHTLTQMKTLTQRAFWRQDFFPLLVWSKVLDDVLCYPRACNLEFTLWRPAYHPRRVQYMSRVFSIYNLNCSLLCVSKILY